MSSPMITRMLGFFCATAGMLATITAGNASRPSKVFLVVLMILTSLLAAYAWLAARAL
jgi:hypothetical protein